MRTGPSAGRQQGRPAPRGTQVFSDFCAQLPGSPLAGGGGEGRAGGLGVPRARCGPAGLCRKMSYDGNEEARTGCFSRSPVQSPKVKNHKRGCQEQLLVLRDPLTSCRGQRGPCQALASGRRRGVPCVCLARGGTVGMGGFGGFCIRAVGVQRLFPQHVRSRLSVVRPPPPPACVWGGMK